MNIPLNQFEQHVGETMLQRGLSYFRKGLVETPQELSPGVYEAMVEGTDIYRVTVTIKNHAITSHTCTCPYDMGPICKHVVALLFALQDDLLDLSPKPAKKGTKASGKPRKKGRKTIAEQVDEVLKNSSPDVVMGFIREECLNEPVFRRRFLAQFAHQLEGESKALYARQIKEVLQSAKGRHGFIEWNRVRDVGRAMNDLLQTAYNHLRNNNFSSALWISCAVLEELTKALQFADDSDGDIGGGIDGAIDVMNAIASGDPPEAIRKELLDYAIGAFQKQLFEGWDWHTGMILLAARLAKGEQEIDLLLQLMEEMSYSKYETEVIELTRLDLLRKGERHAEAEAFLQENINNPRIREIAINEALAAEDLDRAEALAHEGIRNDEKKYPGLAETWWDYLLQIAVKRKDVEMVLHLARFLLKKSNRNAKYYYELLEQHIDPAQWTGYVDQLLQELKEEGRWVHDTLRSWICIREERWESLLEVVSSDASLHSIKEHEQYLGERYPEELAALYAEKIRELLERQTGRKYYKEACRYIRRMHKLGAHEQADALVSEFRKNYPQRRALMEELAEI